jgi:hypothetical protein
MFVCLTKWQSISVYIASHNFQVKVRLRLETLGGILAFTIIFTTCRKTLCSYLTACNLMHGRGKLGNHCVTSRGIMASATCLHSSITVTIYYNFLINLYIASANHSPSSMPCHVHHSPPTRYLLQKVTCFIPTPPPHSKIRSINFAEKQLLMRVAGVEIL